MNFLKLSHFVLLTFALFGFGSADLKAQSKTHCVCAIKNGQKTACINIETPEAVAKDDKMVMDEQGWFLGTFGLPPYQRYEKGVKEAEACSKKAAVQQCDLGELDKVKTTIHYYRADEVKSKCEDLKNKHVTDRSTAKKWKEKMNKKTGRQMIKRNRM